MTVLTHSSAASEQLTELWRQQVATIVELSRDTLPPGEADGCRANELLLSNQLLAAGRQQLAETEAALARVKAGSYGQCEHCSGAISPERLEILPAARYCVTCQAQHTAAMR
jgi:RNA polymerase-binding transcription factor DksA